MCEQNPLSSLSRFQILILLQFISGVLVKSVCFVDLGFHSLESKMVLVIRGNDPNDHKMNSQERPKKTQKRKRATLVLKSLGTEEKIAQIEALRKELDGLFGYYNEMMGQAVGLDVKQCGHSCNAVVGVLIEEKRLPLSKLVDEIYDEVKGNGVCGSVTVASVKNTVLLVGQRIMYGASNADADVLEDDSDSCLWCWEVMTFYFF